MALPPDIHKQENPDHINVGNVGAPTPGKPLPFHRKQLNTPPPQYKPSINMPNIVNKGAALLMG